MRIDKIKELLMPQGVRVYPPINDCCIDKQTYTETLGDVMGVFAFTKDSLRNCDKWLLNVIFEMANFYDDRDPSLTSKIQEIIEPYLGHGVMPTEKWVELVGYIQIMWE